MELLKKRNFGLVMNDTFLFFKQHGKPFFKHYFTLNGIFLMILVTLIFFTFKYYFESLFSSIHSGNKNNFDVYVNNNPGLFISIGIVFLILIAILTIFSISMPILYLKNIALKKPDHLTTKEVWNQLMEIKSKMFLFLLSLIILAIPFGALLFLMTKMPNYFILWLPFYLIVLPMYITWIYQSYFIFLIDEKPLLESYKSGFENIKSTFWISLGNIVVMYIIIQVIQVILSIIPYLILAFNIFVNPNQGSRMDQDETFSMVGIMLSIIFVLFILSSYILNNLIIVNQGIIFFTCKENAENLSATDLIDSIGRKDEQN